MDDWLEAFGYFTFFWLFLFNKKFRHDAIQEWKAAKWSERFWLALEAVSSLFCGLILPLFLLWWLLS